MQKQGIKSLYDNKLEYYIRERRVVRAEITIERVVNLVGLGASGLIGSGAMITNILS
jgi:hypothetical protein